MISADSPVSFRKGDRITITHTDDPHLPVGVPGTVQRIASEGFLSVLFDGMSVNLAVLPGSDTIARLPTDEQADPAPCPECGFVDTHDDCGGCYACEGGDCATCRAGIYPEGPAPAPVAGPQVEQLRDEALDRLGALLNRPA